MLKDRLSGHSPIIPLVSVPVYAWLLVFGIHYVWLKSHTIMYLFSYWSVALCLSPGLGCVAEHFLSRALLLYQLIKIMSEIKAHSNVVVCCRGVWLTPFSRKCLYLLVFESVNTSTMVIRQGIKFVCIFCLCWHVF